MLQQKRRDMILEGRLLAFIDQVCPCVLSVFSALTIRCVCVSRHRQLCVCDLQQRHMRLGHSIECVPTETQHPDRLGQLTTSSCVTTETRHHRVCRFLVIKPFPCRWTTSSCFKGERGVWRSGTITSEARVIRLTRSLQLWHNQRKSCKLRLPPRRERAAV